MQDMKMMSSNISHMDLVEQRALQDLDYSGLNCQGGARSIFYLSKLAQTLQLDITIPPSVLLGFNNHSRILYNDPKSGRIKVEPKQLEPEDVQLFIKTNINEYFRQNFQPIHEEKVSKQQT